MTSYAPRLKDPSKGLEKVHLQGECAHQRRQSPQQGRDDIRFVQLLRLLSETNETILIALITLSCPDASISCQVNYPCSHSHRCPRLLSPKYTRIVLLAKGEV